MFPLEILDRTRVYLNGDITLHDLESWIVPRLESLLADRGSMTYLLAGAIEFGLAEISIGDIDEEAFRRQLQVFLSAHHRVFGGATESLVISAAADTLSESIFVSVGTMPRGSYEYRTPAGASS
jgi:hypothetical protein